MRQVMRRFAVLGSTSLFTQLIAFVALAIVARRVGPSYLGSYTVALSLVTFISLPQSLGLTMVGIRDVTREPGRAREIAAEVFLIQMMIAVVGYIAILALTPLIAPNGAMRSLLPIVSVFFFTGTSFEWTLQGLGQIRSMAVSRVVGQVVYGVLVPFLVVRGLSGVERYAWLMLAGLAVKHLLTVFFLVRAAGPPDFRVSVARLRERARNSLAMGYASIIGQLYGTIDQIMLGYFSTAFDAGEYAVANRIPNAVGTFAGSWTAVVYPHSAHLGNTDRARLRTDAARLLSVVALFAFPLAACTPFVARGLLVAAFGGQYGAASTAFSLLTLTMALGLIDGTVLTMLMGLGRDRFFAKRITVTTLLNVVLNLLVIPIYGRDGAAVDTIISELLAFVLMLRGFRDTLGGLDPEWGRLARIALATAPAVLALALVPTSVLVWLRVAMGAMIYVLGAMVFGAVGRNEIRAALFRDKPIATAEG